MKHHSAFIFFVFSLLVGSTLFAQQKGSINGLVVDKETNEPLPGVNILVKGTYFGASTDLDGFFQIQNVDPGEYEIEISYIGYKIIRQTGVEVEANKALTLNFEMESSVLALGQEIEVIGEKPLMDIEETSTVRSLSKEDIQNRIVDNALELVSQQVGIVKQDDEIHIRGGRDDELAYRTGEGTEHAQSE